MYLYKSIPLNHTLHVTCHVTFVRAVISGALSSFIQITVRNVLKQNILIPPICLA